jgi:NAD kinase
VSGVSNQSTTSCNQLSENSRDEANVWIDSLQHYRLARGGSVEVSASPYPIVTVNRADEDTRDWLKALKGTCLSLHAPPCPSRLTSLTHPPRLT